MRSSRISTSPGARLLAGVDEDVLDDAALEIGDDLQLRARHHPALAAHRPVELGEAGPDEEGDDEGDDEPQQQVRGRRGLILRRQIFEMGAVHVGA